MNYHIDHDKHDKGNNLLNLRQWLYHHFNNCFHNPLHECCVFDYRFHDENDDPNVPWIGVMWLISLAGHIMDMIMKGTMKHFREHSSDHFSNCNHTFVLPFMIPFIKNMIDAMIKMRRRSGTGIITWLTWSFQWCLSWFPSWLHHCLMSFHHKIVKKNMN